MHIRLHAVINGSEDTASIYWVQATDTAKHPTAYRTPSQQSIILPQMSIVLRMRNPAPNKCQKPHMESGQKREVVCSCGTHKALNDCFCIEEKDHEVKNGDTIKFPRSQDT